MGERIAYFNGVKNFVNQVWDYPKNLKVSESTFSNLFSQMTRKWIGLWMANPGGEQVIEKYGLFEMKQQGISIDSNNREGIKEKFSEADVGIVKNNRVWTLKWLWGKIQRWFNEVDAQAILSIPISYTRQKDRWIWNYIVDDVYCIKIGYVMAKEEVQRRRKENKRSEGREKKTCTGWRRLYQNGENMRRFISRKRVTTTVKQCNKGVGVIGDHLN
ncbi:hypothetical protein ACH5RR_006905 [Cinchona calisaya]|uniref:Uncharacterized protein n=1 Tax=Cinchona calisaya TaxID=153742 RepID=A0ABD3AQ91_9GENT